LAAFFFITFSCFVDGFAIRLGTPLNMPAIETDFFADGTINGWRAAFLAAVVGRLLLAIIAAFQRMNTQMLVQILSKMKISVIAKKRNHMT